MRNVIIEDRSWRAEDARSVSKSRQSSADPVEAALVGYTYGRV
jgi:hypothetical protein